MQRESDRLCREYGLSVIEHPQRGKSKHYGEWRAEQEGRPTYLSLIKADVDAAIRQSMTERQFFLSPAADGLRHQSGQGHHRASARQGQRKKAHAQPGRSVFPGEHPQTDSGPAPPQRRKRRSRNGAGFWGIWKQAKKATAFAPLLPLLLSAGGIPPKAEPPAQAGASYTAGRFDPGAGAYRRSRLLSRHRIDTLEQLNAYRSDVESQLAGLTEQRKSLYRKLRTKQCWPTQPSRNTFG